jgi:hypothetical protein
MLVKIYSIMSCIPSNDFVDWCALKSLNYKYYRIRDPQFPQVRYDYTLDQLEELYSREFSTFPIIYIDETQYRSISAAKEFLNEHYNIH